MATLKLYFQNATAPYVPATIRAAWDKTSSAVTSSIGTSKSGSSTSKSVSVGSTTADWDVLVVRFSYILAQDIYFGGSVSGVIGALQAVTTLGAKLHVHAFVTQGQSDTLRGTILSDLIDSQAFTTTYANTGEAFSGTLSNLQCYSGDVLVVEVGYRASSSSSLFSGYIYYGGTSDTDLTDGEDARDYPGWIQFEYITSVLSVLYHQLQEQHIA